MSKNRRATDDADPLAATECQALVIESGLEVIQTSALQDGSRPGRPEDFLIGKEPIRRRYYNPLTVPGLFEKFAATHLQPDSIRSFAEEHGMLGVPVTTLLSSVAGPAPTRPGERVSDWRAEIIDLRAATKLWQALRSRDQRLVSHYLVRSDTWADGSFLSTFAALNTAPDPTWLLLKRDDDDRMVGFEGVVAVADPPNGVTNARDAAELAVLGAINLRLGRYSLPYMSRRSPRAEGYVMRVAPRNLIGAIWWQFARTVMGEATYRKCKVCSRVIELSTSDQGWRADRVFCSNACKLKDHRAKVKRAKEMKAKGKTVRQIATHFDTTTDTIKNWLTKKK